MKKYIIAISALVFLTVSCSNFLEEDPKNFISPTTFFSNYDECVVAVNGCYDLMTTSGLQDGNYWGAYRISALMTDEMTWSNNGNPMREIANCEYTSSNTILYNYWRNSYKIINWCNQVIDGIENSPINENQKPGLIGQAKFIRGLFYSHLVNLFGDVPLILKSTTSLDGNNVSRDDALLVFDAIIEDFKYAEENLVDIPQQKGRVSSGAAKTMLVKTYMQLAGYPYNDTSKMTLAKDKAVEIINNASNYGYQLVNDYAQVFEFENEGNAEVILDAQYIKSLEEGSNIGDYFFGFGGFEQYGGSGALAFLVKEYAQSFQTGDLRRDRVVGDFNINAVGNIVTVKNATQWRNAKYRKALPVDYVRNSGPLNFIILRYADVLLMAAEAINETNGGPTIEAYEYINQVRRRAYGFDINTPNPSVDLTGLNKEDFFNAIVDERSWELGGEGFRWYDLKRWKLLLDKVRATTQPAATNIEEKHYFHPIPFKDITINPNLLPQNEGWE